MPKAPKLRFDHITVVARSLEAGLAYVQQQIGIQVPAGGSHCQMGTHNCLLRLGDKEFLEIIAIDPQAEVPQRPRWFNLDQPLLDDARLATWVMGSSDIAASLGGAIEAAGKATHITRGELSWQISIADDGKLAMDGAFPTLIEWRPGPHPASAMADLGCSLKSLSVTHPGADVIQNFLKGLCDDPRLRIETGPHFHIAAEIATPQGLRRLS